MPTSYNHLAVHIVFSTKKRYKFLTGDKRTEMHKYIGGIIKNIKGHPILINGVDDHVHILCIMPKEMSLAQFVQTIKSNSSKWFGQMHHDKFAWQTGYGAFAVSKSVMPSVEEYIRNQEQHHQGQSFEDEFKKMVELHGFIYEPDNTRNTDEL